MKAEIAGIRVSISRVINTGDHENFRPTVEVTALVEDSASAEDAARQLREMASRQIQEMIDHDEMLRGYQEEVQADYWTEPKKETERLQALLDKLSADERLYIHDKNALVFRAEASLERIKQKQEAIAEREERERIFDGNLWEEDHSEY